MKELIMKFFLIILALYILNVSIYAADNNEMNDISIGYGTSSENIDIYKISTKSDLNKYLFKNKYKYLPSYYETSFGYWKGQNSENIKSLSFTPMFSYEFEKYYDSTPYIEIGIGLTYISDTQLDSEDFGTHIQFGDIVGLGFKFSDFDLSFRYIHYSNAGMDSKSAFIDFSMISISYKF